MHCSIFPDDRITFDVELSVHKWMNAKGRLSL